MPDILTKEQRSKRMRLIRSKNTKPEINVRKILFSLGYRYRLHSKDLPGKPDIVFSKKKKVIFVHGCFWHMHEGCKNARLPKSRLDYWLPKLESNVKRDHEAYEKLKSLGWKVLVVWECELRDINLLIKRMCKFLN